MSDLAPDPVPLPPEVSPDLQLDPIADGYLRPLVEEMCRRSEVLLLVYRRDDGAIQTYEFPRRMPLLALGLVSLGVHQLGSVPPFSAVPLQDAGLTEWLTFDELLAAFSARVSEWALVRAWQSRSKLVVDTLWTGQRDAILAMLRARHDEGCWQMTGSIRGGRSSSDVLKEFFEIVERFRNPDATVHPLHQLGRAALLRYVLGRFLLIEAQAYHRQYNGPALGQEGSLS